MDLESSCLIMFLSLWLMYDIVLYLHIIFHDMNSARQYSMYHQCLKMNSEWLSRNIRAQRHLRKSHSTLVRSWKGTIIYLCIYWYLGYALCQATVHCGTLPFQYLTMFTEKWKWIPSQNVVKQNQTLTLVRIPVHLIMSSCLWVNDALLDHILPMKLSS